jgi:L-asparaginase II
LKTTVEISDELIRQAKIKAATEGVTLRALFERGLKLALQAPAASPPQRADFPLIRSTVSEPRLTDEQVAAALYEMDEQEAQRHADAMRR